MQISLILCHFIPRLPQMKLAVHCADKVQFLYHAAFIGCVSKGCHFHIMVKVKYCLFLPSTMASLCSGKCYRNEPEFTAVQINTFWFRNATKRNFNKNTHSNDSHNTWSFAEFLPFSSSVISYDGNFVMNINMDTKKRTPEISYVSSVYSNVSNKSFSSSCCYKYLLPFSPIVEWTLFNVYLSVLCAPRKLH